MSETASFSMVALSEGQAAQTLPLARVTWPEVDLMHWQEFIRSFAGYARCGILALRDGSNYFSGMFAYRVTPDMCLGLTLTVQLFTVVDLANSQAFSRRLLAMVEMKARDFGCSRVEIRLDRAQLNLTSRLRSLGLAETVAIISKPVEGLRGNF